MKMHGVVVPHYPRNEASGISQPSARQMTELFLQHMQKLNSEKRRLEMHCVWIIVHDAESVKSCCVHNIPFPLYGPEGERLEDVHRPKEGASGPHHGHHDGGVLPALLAPIWYHGPGGYIRSSGSGDSRG